MSTTINNILLVDSHCHLSFRAFKRDAKEVIKRALDQKIGMIIVGSNYQTSRRAVELARSFPSGVWAAAGLHPAQVTPTMIEPDHNHGSEKTRVITTKGEEFNADEFTALLKNNKIVAVGEVGLDEPRPVAKAARDRQTRAFKDQLKLAHSLDLPVIIHSRNTQSRIIKILKGRSTKGLVRGVAHFFTGSLPQLQEFLEMGFFVSFSGVVTFTHSYDDLVRAVPLQKLLVETDAPFVAPHPYRGGRNEPAFVIEVAKRLATIKGVTFEKLACQTTQNAKRLFKLSL